MSSDREVSRQITAAMHSITGKRWCSHCQLSKKVEGGTWKSVASGTRRRWKCVDCVERARQRRATTADTPDQSTGIGSGASTDEQA
jgi:transposase-like protein